MKHPSTVFSLALYREMPALLVQWCGAARIESAIEERLAIELSRCDDMSFARSFAAACPVEGCQPKDYLQRVVSSKDGQQLLTGIRFHGELGFAFVDLIASTQPLEDEESVADSIQAIRTEYAPFEPLAARVLWPTDRALVRADGLSASIDQHVVIGPVDELATLRAVSSQNNVSLSAVDDVREAEQFVASEYASFLAERPDLKSILRPADEEDLRSCQRDGVLCYITFDDERIGLLATREELGPLVRGHTVIEQVLVAEFRGKGIAPVAQTLLVSQLGKRSSGELICGTIDDRNHASRATARRVGRREVAAWHWLRWE